jgi:hypothetical protein
MPSDPEQAGTSRAAGDVTADDPPLDVADHDEPPPLIPEPVAQSSSGTQAASASAAARAPGSKAKRNAYTAAQKKELCLFARSNPTLHQGDIAEHFSKEWKTSVDRTWVCKVLKAANKWVHGDAPANQKRARKAKFEELERGRMAWFKALRAQGAVVQDSLLVKKARELAGKLGLTEEEFGASNGWLEGFKKRHNIKSYSLHGESGSASGSGVLVAKGAVPAIIEELDLTPKDVYNADETGLFYRAKPNRTLCTGRVRGKKKAMDRITLLLCVNVDGSDKRKPLVIHKSKKPR